MFRMWGKLFYHHHLLADSVVCNDHPDMTRTHKIFEGLETLCHDFDIQNPIWLDSNIEEFKRVGKTRFHQDNFIETIDFDYFELQIIEEDEP